jgi:uncharacterized surface protein with fasciclin (FAS1) repeats
MIASLRTAAAAVAVVVTLAAAPARADDIVDVATKAGTFNTLVAAVKAAGLVDTLKGKGPFTVFAPTDDAFKKLPAGTVENLLKPENKAQLVSILTYHVLPGRYDAARITGAKARATRFGIPTVQGANVEVDLRQGVKVSGATVTKTDIAATNGVVHVIDTVMLPPKRRAARHH